MLRALLPHASPPSRESVCWRHEHRVCVSEISLTASAGASPERSIPTFRACFRTTTPRFCACALPAGPSRRRSAHPTLRDARQEAGRPLVCAAARPARAQPQDGRKVVAPPGLVGQSFDGDDIAVDGKKSRFAPACPPLTAAQEPALTHGSGARRRPRAVVASELLQEQRNHDRGAGRGRH